MGELKVIPVVVLNSAEDALPLAEALLEGGLPCAEITFRTEAAEESIRRISRALPEMLVGAGTVLKPDQAARAVAAGARFVVSPGTNPDVVRYCLENDVTVIPGVCTPTDIETALGMGLEALKFFPAEAFGGLKTLKALSAPYGAVKFFPTGGISLANLADYLAFSKVLACGGSWMVKPDLIQAGDFAEIARLTEEAVAITHNTDCRI